jgi:hypothetical protein
MMTRDSSAVARPRLAIFGSPLGDHAFVACFRPSNTSGKFPVAAIGKDVLYADIIIGQTVAEGGCWRSTLSQDGTERSARSIA